MLWLQGAEAMGNPWTLRGDVLASCFLNRWVSSVVIEVSNKPACARLVYGDAIALSGLPIMAGRVKTSNHIQGLTLLSPMTGLTRNAFFKIEFKNQPDSLVPASQSNG
jgi:hypothetical protein